MRGGNGIANAKPKFPIITGLQILDQSLKKGLPLMEYPGNPSQPY